MEAKATKISRIKGRLSRFPSGLAQVTVRHNLPSQLDFPKAGDEVGSASLTVLWAVSVLVIQSCPTLCNPMYYKACQAPLSMEFSRQEYWSGLPFPSPGDLPNPGIKQCLLHGRQSLYHLSHQGICN